MSLQWVCVPFKLKIQAHTMLTYVKHEFANIFAISLFPYCNKRIIFLHFSLFLKRHLTIEVRSCKDVIKMTTEKLGSYYFSIAVCRVDSDIICEIDNLIHNIFKCLNRQQKQWNQFLRNLLQCEKQERERTRGRRR